MKLDLISNKVVKTDLYNPNDEYYTPCYAIEPLFKYLKINSNIWCPFDTKDSNYVKELTKQGHNVIYSHKETNQDFFTQPLPQNTNYIISNPPYSIKYEVFKRLFEFDTPFAMLVGVVGLFESQKRFNLFKDNDFEIMYLNKRVSFFQDYNDETSLTNPPFSSVYVCKNVLPRQILFETINK